MHIEPITHPGHETTYTYKLTDGKSDWLINACDAGMKRVYKNGKQVGEFRLFKSALNCVFGVKD